MPESKDTGTQYDSQVFSSGPYEINSYARDKSLVLVRNPHWSQATDPVRHAYPNKIVCTFGLDAATIDQRMIADSGADQTAIMFDKAIEPESLAQVQNNPSVKSRAISGPTGFLRYLAMDTRKIPNLKVRQAIEYAVNKGTYRTARGGVSAGEEGQHGRRHPGGTRPGEHPGQHRAVSTVDLLHEGRRVGDATRAGHRRVGAGLAGRLDGHPTAVRRPPDQAAGQPELLAVQRPEGECRDRQGSAETDVNKASSMWGALDREIMQQAPIVPLVYDESIFLRGSKVGGFYLHPAWGVPDMVAISAA